MNDQHGASESDDDAGAKVKRIVKWALIGAVIGAIANVWLSSGEATGIRVCFALMVAGAGAVTGAMLCANFTADDSDPSIPPH
jgi:uncharacterized membrane protein YeaQ/YmgE (transglycosylase-associated protein family)